MYFERPIASRDIPSGAARTGTYQMGTRDFVILVARRSYSYRGGKCRGALPLVAARVGCASHWYHFQRFVIVRSRMRQHESEAHQAITVVLIRHGAVVCGAQHPSRVVISSE